MDTKIIAEALLRCGYKSQQVADFLQVEKVEVVLQKRRLRGRGISLPQANTHTYCNARRLQKEGIDASLRAALQAIIIARFEQILRGNIPTNFLKPHTPFHALWLDMEGPAEDQYEQALQRYLASLSMRSNVEIQQDIATYFGNANLLPDWDTREELVQDNLGKITLPEQEALAMYYGFGPYSPMTYADMGAHFQISANSARDDILNARANLWKTIRANAMDGYSLELGTMGHMRQLLRQVREQW